MATASEEPRESVGVLSQRTPSRDRVVFGALLFVTVVATAVAASTVGPAVAGKVATAMLPLVLVASLRTDLTEHSMYASLARQR